MNKDRLLSVIDKYEEKLCTMAKDIWDHPQTALLEDYAAVLLEDFFKAEGFRVQRGYTVLPTAFIAEYGSGKPVIGILGEYDALPDLSQEVSAEKKPVEPGKAGHGCGHNLLGTAGVGAALAIKAAIDDGVISGTVKFFGCPAEELVIGKTFMARDGAFDGVDAFVTWHPSSYNAAWGNTMLANFSVKFRFKGTSAHAAAAPHLGRSALDAVELMNVGANYLREHLPENMRMHYSITDGGGVPNTVPSHAEVWYMLRAPEHGLVEDAKKRLFKIADGAAMMTETTLEKVTVIGSVREVLVNTAIRDIIDENMRSIGGPAFTDEDRAFAREIYDTFEPGEQRRGFAPFFIPDDMEGQFLHETVAPIAGIGGCIPVSSDVADASWLAPTSQFGAAIFPLGVALHTWRSAACAGSGIGMHGMLFAAKTIAGTVYDLFTKPEVLEKAKAEFAQNTKNDPYVCPFHMEQTPGL